jgi:ketosteroid isomerase-like protein
MKGTGDVETAGSAARAAFAAALHAGEAAVISALYAQDARLLAPAAPPIRGRAAIERFWQAGVDTGLKSGELEAAALERGDGVAYELGRYTLAVESDDGTVVDRGDYLLVHERQDDGSWRWAVEMFNPDAPTVHPREGRG